MTGFGSDPLQTVRREDGPPPALVLVRRLRHRPEVVWRALVDPGQLPEWSPWTAARSLDEPGPVVLTMIDGSDEVEFEGKVLVAEAPRRLEYTMGTETIRWELEPAGQGTVLTLRQTVEDPSWLPKIAAGWHICLAVADRFLDGDPIGPITGGDAMRHGWRELNDRYSTELGGSAGTP